MANKEQRQTDNNSKPVTYSYTGESRTYKDGRGRTAHRTVVRLVKLLDVILVSIPYAVAWGVRHTFLPERKLGSYRTLCFLILHLVASILRVHNPYQYDF